MTTLLQPFQDFARWAACALRAAMLRGAGIAAVPLRASLGAAFLAFSCYLGLRFLSGPRRAALTLGAVLLALAAGIMLMVRSAEATILPVATATPQKPPAATSSRPADAATTAAFTVAFLLGRPLADHLADRRGRSGRSLHIGEAPCLSAQSLRSF